MHPRYEHARPGDLLHLGIKRLVRSVRGSYGITCDCRDRVPGIGAESSTSPIDDPSRIAFSAITPDETRTPLLDFLKKALG